MKKIGKIIENTLVTTAIVVFIWMFLSWVDIIADNMESEVRHHPLNFFTVIFTEREEI